MSQESEPTEIISPQAHVPTEIVNPQPSVSSSSGPVIDGYESFSELGRGGFATVYRARQSALGRDVAVKVLHRTADDDAALASFRRESHLVADLSWHPHVAPVLEAGTTEPSSNMGRHPYLCFQLVEHGSLEDQVDRDGPLNWVAATRAAIEVADALAAAHAIGVIHRDIKIGNVLVDRLGRGQLADFGIASLTGERDEGGVAMTVAHAPPELFEGRSASPQSDIYSLGSMLYELLVGHAAFVRRDGEQLAPMIERIVSDPLPSVPPTAAPEGVASVVGASMAKQPEDRYSSAIEFGRALQRAQSEASLETTPMPYCDRMAPHTAAAADRPALLVRPPTTAIAAGSSGRSNTSVGVGRWLVAGGLALGLACGLAGGVVLVDRLGDDTTEVAAPATPDARADVAAPSETRETTEPSSGIAEVESVSASQTSPPLGLADGSELIVAASDVVDGDRATSWLVPGDGAGVTMQFDLGSTQEVVSLGMLPGFSGVDPVNGAERFNAVRRVTAVRWTFDDGTTVEQSFADLDDVQRLAIEATTTRTLQLEILATTQPGALDFTAVAEVEIEVAT